MNREGDSGEIMHPTAMAIAEGDEKHWTWIVEEGVGGSRVFSDD